MEKHRFGVICIAVLVLQGLVCVTQAQDEGSGPQFKYLNLLQQQLGQSNNFINGRGGGAEGQCTCPCSSPNSRRRERERNEWEMPEFELPEFEMPEFELFDVDLF